MIRGKVSTQANIGALPTSLVFVMLSEILDIVGTDTNVCSRMGKLKYDPPRAHREKKHLQVVPWTKRAAITNSTGNREGTGVIGPHGGLAMAQIPTPHVESPLARISEVGDQTVRRMTATESEVGTAPSTLITIVVKDAETVHVKKKG